MLWKPDSLSKFLGIKPTTHKFMTTVLFWDKFVHGDEQKFIGRIYDVILFKMCRKMWWEG
jgi:hypothetical protein